MAPAMKQEPGAAAGERPAASRLTGGAWRRARRRPFEAGDRVNWSYRPTSGHGHVVPLAAVMREVTDGRDRIAVACKVQGVWQREERTVALNRLTPRVKEVPEGDD